MTATRTCRPCHGTGVGTDGFGSECRHCDGTGRARPYTPPRLRREFVAENTGERATEAQCDVLARLIDACDGRMPEVQAASDAIGRPDFTEAQAGAYIAALEVLVPPPPQRRVRARGRTSWGALTTAAWIDALHESMAELRDAQSDYNQLPTT